MKKSLVHNVIFIFSIYVGFCSLCLSPANGQTLTHNKTAAENLPKYKVGSGNKYLLTVGNDPSEVRIAFVESTDKKLTIEIFIESKNDNAALGVKMWQQFQLGMVNGKVAILKGMMKIPQIEKPQIFPNEYLQGYNGVQMKSFLLGSNSEIEGKKIATENVTVNGQTYKATHYQHGENAQTVDFWISDAAQPLGLVKMTSQGGAMGMNYTMEYRGTVSNIKSEINEAQAEPLNDMAKAFLPLLGPSLFKF